MQTPHQPGQSQMTLSQHSTPVSGQSQQQLHQSTMDHQVIQSQHLHSRRVSPQSNVRSCKAEGGHNVSATVCANCGTTTTPLWRRAPNGETICNACGLYLKARNTVRPPWLKRNAIKKASPSTSTQVPDNNPSTNNGSCPGDGHCDGTGGSTSCSGCPAYNQHQVNRQALICANCGTNTTPLWRRDEAGNTICNACGLYFKLHNVHRPVTMKRSVIKRRKRVALATSPPPSHRHHSGNNVDSDNNRKNRVQQHPPTPVSSSGSEHGYSDSEDDTFSNDGQANTGQKRKASISHSNNKRQCGNMRQVPAIEDYSPSKQHDSSQCGGEPIWNHNNNHLAERRRSLPSVEPALSSSPLPQVQIHGNNSPLSGGRLMGTPTIPLPSGFSGSTGFQSSHSPNIRSSSQASTISALLNPSSPICSSPPQLPPITMASAMDHSISLHDHIHQTSQPTVEPLATQQILHAHRQALQREVSHLSMLLKRTTAILVDLDQAMNANDANSKSSPSTPPALSPNQLPPMCLANDVNHLHNNSSTTQSYMTLPPVSLVGSRSSSPQS